MRPEPNKEIDLLLRQLAGRDGAPVSEIEEQHLDADELNSYVANALPAPARARYTEHLADCSNCRKMVVQLSAAQGPVAVPQSATAVAPSGLKSFLASLFSPMVLRYAAPVLGLVVIVIVGFVVLRQDQRGSDVAQLSNTDQNEFVLQSPTEAPLEGDRTVAKRRAPEPGRVAPATSTAKDAPTHASNEAADTATTAGAPPPPKAAPAEAEAQPAPETQKEKKTEATAPTTHGFQADKQRMDDAVKNEARKVDQVAATPGASVTARPAKRMEMRAGKTKTGEATGAAGVTASVSTETRDSTRARDEAANSDAAAATRSVAGRRFRKSGGVWIDTAYNSSSAVTNVARGSEQFRALVADEPSIRTIAEELDGQIIVVWKGRTYRIR